MTDREMLELAAKAANIELGCWDEQGSQWIRSVDDPAKVEQTGNGWGAAVFDPLADDGDAFRLAVYLKISPQFDDDGRVFTGYELIKTRREYYSPIHEVLSDDPAKALRRAITRRAAEIGRSMP